MSKEDALLNLLNSISFPLLNHLGKEVNVRPYSAEGTGFDHIVQPRHNLTISDIGLIPTILSHPSVYITDPNNTNRKNYYGLRVTSDKQIFLKIVTDVNLDGTESIVTLFPTRKVKR